MYSPTRNGRVKMMVRPATTLPSTPCIASPNPTPATPMPATRGIDLHAEVLRGNDEREGQDDHPDDPDDQHSHRRLEMAALEACAPAAGAF